MEDNILDTAEVTQMTVTFEDLKSFIKDSQSRWGDLKQRIKEDRSFLSGEQFEDIDDRIMGKNRIKEAVNVVSNTCNSIASNYAKYPFSWMTDIMEVNGAIDSFLHSNQNGDASTLALRDSVSFGLGVMVVSTDYNLFNKQVEPIIYAVSNTENVFLDPCISTIDGSDAQKAAIVEIKSRQFIKNTYGVEFLAETDPNTDLYSIPGLTYDRKFEQPIITYYVKESGVVKIYTFLNGQIVDVNEIRSDYIPVVPVFGERTWDDDKITYQGIVRKAKPVQKLINYAYMNLCERLSVSPKNVFIASRDAIQNVEQYWKDANKSLNPLLIYNAKDSKGNPVEAPSRVDNAVRFDDLSGILGTVLDLMTSITGVNSVGLAADDKTATASMLEHSAYSNNIAHYYNNLKSSFRLVGHIFCTMLSLPVQAIQVIQGVDEMAANIEARQVLQALIPVMPDRANELAIGVLRTYPENMIIQDTIAKLTGGKTPREMELEKALEETTRQLEIAQNQNANFDKQVKMEQQKLATQYQMHSEKLQLEALKSDADHEHDLAKESMKIAADGEKQLKETFTDVLRSVHNV